VHKCNRLPCSSAFSHLVVAADHQTRLCWRRPDPQADAPPIKSATISGNPGYGDSLPETTGENLTPHGVSDGLIRAGDPDAAPGKLSSDVGHNPAFRVENERKSSSSRLRVRSSAHCRIGVALCLSSCNEDFHNSYRSVRLNRPCCFDRASGRDILVRRQHGVPAADSIRISEVFRYKRIDIEQHLSGSGRWSVPVAGETSFCVSFSTRKAGLCPTSEESLPGRASDTGTYEAVANSVRRKVFAVVSGGCQP